MKKKWLFTGMFLGVLASATSALWAAGAFDRITSGVLKLGSGQAVTEQLIYDTGNGASNAALASDGSANLTVTSASSTFSSAVNATHGGSLGGTYSGGVTFSGNPVTFSALIEPQALFMIGNGSATNPDIATTNDVNSGIYFPSSGNMAFTTGANERLLINSTNVRIDAPLVANTTGGNVPHGCLVYRNTGSSGTVEAVCPSNNIAVGGGCGSTGVIVSEFCPSNGSGICIGSTPTAATGYLCEFASASTELAWAVCCFL